MNWIPSSRKLNVVHELSRKPFDFGSDTCIWILFFKCFFFETFIHMYSFSSYAGLGEMVMLFWRMWMRFFMLIGQKNDRFWLSLYDD